MYKGYEKNRIWIIGGANIDICGKSLDALRDYDSNIGNISFSYGGVGRNIAQAAAQLGADVHFLGCFSNDYYGRHLWKNCLEQGINLDHSIRSDKYPTSIYLAILDDNNDMRIAMSDMRIMEEVSLGRIDNMLAEIAPEDYLVVDTNLDEDVLRHIFFNSPCAIAMDPVSASKIGRLRSIIDNISIFKPNEYEAKALTGIEIVDDDTAIKSLNWFMDRGMNEVIITMADKGVLLGLYEEDEMYWLTHRNIRLESANGGGDAFFGAYLSRRAYGASPAESAKFAISAAVSLIESKDKTGFKLDEIEVEKRIPSLGIKEYKL